MFIKIFVLLCALAAVMSYPYPDEAAFYAYEPYAPVAYQRVRRDLELQGQGGGSRKDGFDVKIDGRAPVWQSDNGKHQFDVTGGYTQHLGGPYGNSNPDKRIGGIYTFRW